MLQYTFLSDKNFEEDEFLIDFFFILAVIESTCSGKANNELMTMKVPSEYSALVLRHFHNLSIIPKITFYYSVDHKYGILSFADIYH